MILHYRQQNLKQNATALSQHYLLLLRTFNPLKTEQCESTFCTILPDIRKNNVLFAGSQASPACPSDKISIKVKMSMEHWWNDTDKGKPKA
jgi:hypothetical protein